MSCAIAKEVGAQLHMIREDFINNAGSLMRDGYNTKCLFILHVLGKYIITQY